MTTANLQESAATLLLRSPRLSVSLILELLDLSDADFRELTLRNARVRELLEARRRGELTIEEPELKTCPGCGDWFIPYAHARCCSDDCVRISRLQSAGS
ncbi:MAG: hypothetical protein R3E82_19650 [Pseudomonadales bacterium]|nr:hypothetical protein [Pseudomonadales bacterium]